MLNAANKVKAQLSVLKKAVVEEQSKRGELQEALHAGDVVTRKLQQEMSSVNFRNEQLTKRIEVLQNELEILQYQKPDKHAKNEKKLPSIEDDRSIFNDELQSKINETARLYTEINDLRLRHQQTVASLEEELTLSQRKLAENEVVILNAKSELESNAARLKAENMSLQLKLREATTEQERLQSELASSSNRVENLTVSLQQKTRVSVAEISTLPFNVSDNQQFNAENPPSVDLKQAASITTSFELCLDTSRKALNPIVNFLTYTEQRIHMFPANVDVAHLSPVKSKACDVLKEAVSCGQALNRSLSIFKSSEMLDKLAVKSSIGAFSQSLSTAIFSLTACLSEECLESWCNSALDSQNAALVKMLEHWERSIVNLLTAVSALLVEIPPSESNLKRLFFDLSSCQTLLLNSSNDVYRELSKKISLEHQLPFITESVTTGDECLLSAFNSFLVSLTLVSNALQKLTSALDDVGYTSLKSIVSKSAVRQCGNGTVQYLENRPSQEALETVPYEEAIQNKKEVTRLSSQCTSLSEQVSELERKIQSLEQDKEHLMLDVQSTKLKRDKEMIELERKMHNLEQDKEHWMLEAQLTKLKLDKEKTEAHHHDSRALNSEAEQNQSLEHFPLSGADGLSITVQTKPDIDTDAQTQADMVRSVLSDRISNLICDLQTADSKSAFFYQECEALLSRLKESDLEKGKLSLQVSEKEISRKSLEDELETTRRSYEQQLSSMSEHLAAMNERLCAQEEEIQELKAGSSSVAGGVLRKISKSKRQ